jgi:phage terminase large subunit-like protein
MNDRVLVSQAPRIKMLAHRGTWVKSARPNQLPPADDDWDIWMPLAGRGFGKTRLAAEAISWDTWQHKDTITHVVASTHGDLRSVCYEGESGLLNVIPPECIKTNGYNRSLGEIHLTNGSIIRGFSAETPDRARGPQCHRLWGDELAAWDLTKGNAQAMFDMAMLGLRLGNRAYAIITTTPKPIQLIKNLKNLANGVINDHNVKLKDLRVRLTTGSTTENFSNLSSNFKIIISQYAGTRLGRQELEAEVLEDVQGALWSAEIIESLRVHPSRLPPLSRVVVSIDPAASSNEGSDETGIIVAGISAEGQGYLLEDASGHYKPNEWGMKAIQMYNKWGADTIIGEINNGGDMVENTLRSIDENIPFKSMRASRGKMARAEPISTLYEQRKVHHVGHFPKLEDQLMALTTDFSRASAGYSPDRADALVWAFTEVMLGDVDGQGIYEYYRTLNSAQEAEKITGPVGSKEVMVLMRTDRKDVPTIYSRSGWQYKVHSDGTVLVIADETSVFFAQGFCVAEPLGPI